MAGSDSPIEPLSPLLGVGAAVDRPGLEALTVNDAISLYTRNAAYASFEEHAKGTIAIGKLADLVVLEKDPHKTPASKISHLRGLMTIIGGKIAYSPSKLD